MKSSDGFERAKNSKGAVLNTDMGALRAYKAQKAKANEIEMVKRDVTEMKQKIGSIEDMLQKILSAVNKRD